MTPILTKYINDWIINLIEYIQVAIKNEAIQYEAEDNDVIKNINIPNDSDMIIYLDKIEDIIDILTHYTNLFVTNKVINVLKDKSYYYDNNHIKIQEMADKVKKIYNSIKFDNSITIDNISSITDYNHSNIVLYKYIIHYKDDIDKIKHLQNHLFDDKNEQYKMTTTLHLLHKINYLVLPMTIEDQNTRYINISYSNTAITYNMLALVDRSVAIKYGPIQSTVQGINKSSYNRFNTISVKNTNHSVEHTIHTVKNNAIIYDGYNYKNLTPINLKKDQKWYPLQGCNIKAYILNQEFEKQLFDKMNIITVDNNSSINMEIPDKINESSIIKSSFNGIKNIASKINNSTKEKELYLFQYFNVMNNIKLLRKKEYNSIDIVPNSIYTKYLTM